MYAKKQESQDGATVRYKAKLVVKGYAQREYIDYNEIFSLVKHFHSDIAGIGGTIRLGARSARCEDCISP